MTCNFAKCTKWPQTQRIRNEENDTYEPPMTTVESEILFRFALWYRIYDTKVVFDHPFSRRSSFYDIPIDSHACYNFKVPPKNNNNNNNNNNKEKIFGRVQRNVIAFPYGKQCHLNVRLKYCYRSSVFSSAWFCQQATVVAQVSVVRPSSVNSGFSEVAAWIQVKFYG